MTRQSSAVAADLQKELQALEATRLEVEQLVVGRQLSRASAERMYAALFLAGFTAFEGFVESLFVGLLVSGQGLQSGRRDVAPRVVVRSHRVARDIILGPGRKYVDWLPFERTIERSAVYFTGGRPFSELSPADIALLERMHRVRNAIAHRSRHSQDIFERLVIAATAVPARERRPGPYLRGLFRTSPAQTRYEQLMAESNRMAAVMAT